MESKTREKKVKEHGTDSAQADGIEEPSGVSDCVADARAPRDGRVIEEVGWYNPMMEGENFHLKMDRVEYWLKCGAQPTETVASFIKRARKKARQHAAPSA